MGQNESGILCGAACKGEERTIASVTESLHAAIRLDDPDGVQWALKAGGSVAKPSRKDVSEDGEPVFVLHLAATHASSEVMRLLLKAAADPGMRDHDGWDALFYASQRGHLELSGILLESGIDPLRCDKAGLNALDYSRDCETREGLEAMLQEKNIELPVPKALQYAPIVGLED
eukprot:gnl/TRDRNA2_/TRDRNA2_187363_c0_seq1.p1 gnl/TRDRNA2_/TRDRNA2_187363_c0~~gnl/TRDRNA2_/TRDRNA2_187363_c0_seq1.p1  ORF type:complete len:174 (+),score=38.17 gnl/TRDRNA2_/TRDRNA2_187363_c0_seq1:109-630(+)